MTQGSRLRGLLAHGWRLRTRGLALGVVGVATLLAAQTPQQPTFRTGINFVRVDVYPTLDGKIVTDLKQDDFEVLEDGVPQTVETFERVAIRAPGPEIERGDPTSVQAQNDAVGDPRSRVFVLFLDTYHIGALVGKTSRQAIGNIDPHFDNAGRAAMALSGFLQRLIGPDDLIALMTPEMALNALTFVRRPSSIEEFLKSGLWQRDPSEYRDLDARDQMYTACYGLDSAVAAEMTRRRHERVVLSALEGLVLHLRTLREERKAILLVSEGWDVFGPMAIGGSMPRAVPRIGVTNGKPTVGDPRSGVPMEECEKDRLALSDIDDDRELRDLLQMANRSNATFYPVDPRGLEAPATTEEAHRIIRRQAPLRELAANTDGMAVIDTNDLNPGLRRIADDLSSYYLLGYTSTNGRTDGRFRKIAVRVKRPGVVVRARPGYLAPTAAEVKSADEANVLARNPDDGGVQAALSALDNGLPGRVLMLRGSYAWSRAREAARAVAAVVVELEPAAARGPGWAQGGRLSAALLDADGHPLASGSGTVSYNSRSCVIHFTGTDLPPGEYFARVKAQWSVMTTTEQVRIVVPEPSAAANVLGQAILFRRSPYVGPGYQPTADTRFRKADRVRVELPVAAAVDRVAGRLLDRNGRPLPIPVVAEQREDAGVRFVAAELAMAPLAQGDYVIEISATRGGKTDKMLTAIRIVP